MTKGVGAGWLRMCDVIFSHIFNIQIPRNNRWRNLFEFFLHRLVIMIFMISKLLQVEIFLWPSFENTQWWQGGGGVKTKKGK